MDERSTFIQGEINARKQLLADSDYKCLKYSDGALSEEEYTPVKEKRAQWRKEIDELEAELAELNKTMNEKGYTA